MKKLIVDYQKSWAKDFKKIKVALYDVLDSSIIKVEHVGSTSIQDLSAKPIIDVDIIYDERASFKAINNDLILLGYFHAGDQGVEGREVFKRNCSAKNHPILDKISHHLYVCHFESDALKRHLAFRDFLKGNVNYRMQYEKLKMEIAQMANQDKKRYSLLKEEQAKDFIEAILKKCL